MYDLNPEVAKKVIEALPTNTVEYGELGHGQHPEGGATSAGMANVDLEVKVLNYIEKHPDLKSEPDGGFRTAYHAVVSGQ
jgi:hypothetical protein